MTTRLEQQPPKTQERCLIAGSQWIVWERRGERIGVCARKRQWWRLVALVQDGWDCKRVKRAVALWLRLERAIRVYNILHVFALDFTIVWKHFTVDQLFYNKLNSIKCGVLESTQWGNKNENMMNCYTCLSMRFMIYSYSLKKLEYKEMRYY